MENQLFVDADSRWTPPVLHCPQSEDLPSHHAVHETATDEFIHSFIITTAILYP